MARNLRIAFCLPGREFSGRFLDCWTALLSNCHKVGIDYVVSREYDPVVYYARNKVAGGNSRSGKLQKPWGGTVDYDFMLWIDSDVIFTIQDLVALLQCEVDMVSGLYLMANRTHYAVVEDLDEEAFKRDGHFVFMTPAEVAKKSAPFEVGYAGFGFTLVRNGVFERLEYPWFRPIFMQIGDTLEFTSEDVGFALQAKAAGIKMMAHPQVIVGHEKQVVLRP